MPNLLEVLGLKPLPDQAGADPRTGDQSGDDDDVAVVADPAKAAGTAVGKGGPKIPAKPGTAPAPSGAKGGASPQQAAYATERTAVVKLHTALARHAQAAHVADKTGPSAAALGAANAEAAKPDWPKAMAKLAESRTACTDGKVFADKFAAFMVKRAAANLLLAAAQTNKMSALASYPAKLAGADAKAAPATRNYAGAEADCDFILNGLRPRFKKIYVDDMKPKVAALKALDAATKFVPKEIAEIEATMAQQEAGIAAGRWRQVTLAHQLLKRKMGRAEKMTTRRAGFDGERPKADIAVSAVEANGAPVAAALAAIRKRLAEADAMASSAGMRFEDATVEVLAIIATCEAVDRVARDAVGYGRERGALAARLTGLRAHGAAAKIQAELDVARGLLDDAAKAAGDKGAPGTAMPLLADPKAHDIAAARVLLARATATLATAASLAEGLDGVAAMEDLVIDKGNASALRKAVDTLSKELASAVKAEHADLAKLPFDAVRDALAAAKKSIDARKTEGVAEALVAAGRKLTDGRRIQIEHSRYLERVAALKMRVDQHQANKAQAAKIQGRIDDISIALFDADAAETAGEHATAIAKLNAAEAAAAAADEALVARIAFDKEANLAQLDLGKPAFAAIKVAQGRELTRARAMASVFNFAEGQKIVKGIRNAMGKSEAEAMAKKAPPDPKLVDKAKELAAAGATAELDALIKELPPTVDKEALIALAEARFKVEFEVESDGNEQVSIQRMCALMKDVPDVTGNPSLKKVTRRVTDDDGSALTAPFYRPSENLVVMNSRPGRGKKADFQPGATGRLPEREEACKPANDRPEELFDFNMLHELAHSIDDAKNYMGTKGKADDHGGWIEIGGNVELIADAVAAATGFGKAPAERRYILDKVLRNPAVAPAPFAGDKARFEKFITAAQTAKVWDKQALTEQATLGKRVYHEAYPNTWYSYLADARKRGITTYQFRAPGEWFSELYAAWKVGKLKPGHPSEGWLKALKVARKGK